MSRELELTSTWLGEPHTSQAWAEFERQLLRSGRFTFLVLAGKRLGDDVQAAQTAFTVERRAAAAPVYIYACIHVYCTCMCSCTCSCVHICMYTPIQSTPEAQASDHLVHVCVCVCVCACVRVLCVVQLVFVAFLRQQM
jgi:hypothetical protein